MKFGPPSALLSSLMLVGCGSSGGGDGASFEGALDGYESDLFAAYSVSRRLLTSYAGPLIRIRRSGDNAEQDIDPSDTGDLDTADLEAFCIAGGGAQNGFVTTIYGQESNELDIVQTTAALQPKIVSSGSTITVNGKPAARFDGVSQTMRGVPSDLTANFSFYCVQKLVSASSYPVLISLRDSRLELRGSSSSGNPEIISDGSVVTGAASCVGSLSQYTWTQLYPGNISGWIDNSLLNTPASSSAVEAAQIRLASRAASAQFAETDFSEAFLFGVDHDSTTRQAIQIIQKNYFGTP